MPTNEASGSTMNKQKRRSGVMSWELWIAGWLPAGIGLISWVVAAFRPDSSFGAVSLLGLLTCVAISVIVHELAHFVVAQRLGLKPWCFSFGHGDGVFAKQFQKLQLIFSMLPYSGRSDPFRL